MAKMLFDYSLPDYAQGDSEYEHCRNYDEIKVLRLVRTYHEFVAQRYGSGVTTAKYQSFKPDKKGKSLRTSQYKDLREYITDHLGDRDPAHFIAFVFEIWHHRKNYGAFLNKTVKVKGVTKTGQFIAPGFAYPSWKFIIENSGWLLEEFKANPGYVPRDFIPEDDLEVNFSRAVENRMRRWCAAYKKTPRDYWLTGKHLFPPFLSSRELPYAREHKDGLNEYAADVEKEFGFTLDELHEFLVELERVEEEVYDERVAQHSLRKKEGLPVHYLFGENLDSK